MNSLNGCLKKGLVAGGTGGIMMNISNLINYHIAAVMLIKALQATGASIDYNVDLKGISFGDEKQISSWAAESVKLTNEQCIALVNRIFKSFK